MSYVWGNDSVNKALAAVDKVSNTNSIGISEKKGLMKISCFSRFFQWMFKGCGLQKTQSEKVIPRIISLFDHILKEKEIHPDLFRTQHNTLNKLILRTEKSKSSYALKDAEKQTIQKIKAVFAASESTVNKKTDPGQAEDKTQPTQTAPVVTGVSKVEQTKETLIRYAKLFPSHAMAPEEEIEKMPDNEVQILFEQLNLLGNSLTSVHKKDTPLFKIKQEGSWIEARWDQIDREIIPDRNNVSLFNGKIPLHLTTLALKEIVSGYLLSQLSSKFQAVAPYAPNSYTYKSTGDLSDGGRGGYSGAVFAFQSVEFIPGTPNDLVQIFGCPKWSLIVATNDGPKFIKHPSPKIKE